MRLFNLYIYKLNRIIQGYSYIAPSVMFGRQHVLTEDLLRPQRNSNRPSTGYLVNLADSGESEFFRHYQLDVSSVPLGDGSFSVCRRCVEISTGKEFAVKITSRRFVELLFILVLSREHFVFIFGKLFNRIFC